MKVKTDEGRRQTLNPGVCVDVGDLPRQLSDDDLIDFLQSDFLIDFFLSDCASCILSKTNIIPFGSSCMNLSAESTQVLGISSSVARKGFLMDWESRRKRPRTTLSTSATGSCPLCNMKFPMSFLEHHASNCQGGDATSDCARGDEKVLVPGFRVIPNFVSESEEKSIWDSLEADHSSPWVDSKNRMTKGYGYQFHLPTRTWDFQPGVPPIPAFLRPVLDRIRDEVEEFRDFRPNQLEVGLYDPGLNHKILPHNDMVRA